MKRYEKKDIYIITNDINSKVYIGQSVNPAHRWEQYCSAVKKKPDAQVITRAMAKYGIEHFTMSILEENVVNYDEREIYWIEKYNSIVPNGYNIAIGGQGTGSGINSPTAKIKSEDVLFELIDELIQNEVSLSNLCKKYNMSYSQMEKLKNGQSYRIEGLNYPLRPSMKHSKEKIDQLTYALKYELDKSLRDLSAEYEIDLSCVNEINQGKMWHRDYLEYPIRLGKMKRAEIIHPLILDELINNLSLNQKEIAKKFNVSQSLVCEINRGKKCHNNNYDYPIRKSSAEYYSTLSPDIVKEIIELLKNTKLTFKEIGKRYEVSPSVIAGINNGKTKKYRIEEYKYPIRNN